MGRSRGSNTPGGRTSERNHGSSPRNVAGSPVPKYFCRACGDKFPNWSQCLAHVRTVERENDPDLHSLTLSQEGRRELQRVCKYTADRASPTPPVTPFREGTPSPSPTNFGRQNPSPRPQNELQNGSDRRLHQVPSFRSEISRGSSPSPVGFIPVIGGTAQAAPPMANYQHVPMQMSDLARRDGNVLVPRPERGGEGGGGGGMSQGDSNDTFTLFGRGDGGNRLRRATAVARLFHSMPLGSASGQTNGGEEDGFLSDNFSSHGTSPASTPQPSPTADDGDFTFEISAFAAPPLGSAATNFQSVLRRGAAMPRPEVLSPSRSSSDASQSFASPGFLWNNTRASHRENVSQSNPLTSKRRSITLTASSAFAHPFNNYRGFLSRGSPGDGENNFLLSNHASRTNEGDLKEIGRSGFSKKKEMDGCLLLMLPANVAFMVSEFMDMADCITVTRAVLLRAESVDKHN